MSNGTNKLKKKGCVFFPAFQLYSKRRQYENPIKIGETETVWGTSTSDF
jgi:hypothetical protein